MVDVGVDLLGTWGRVRSGALSVQFPFAQVGVVRVGAVVRNGSVAVTCCCCEERGAMVLRSRDGGDGGASVERVVVLTSSGRGARVNEDVVSSFEVVRDTMVELFRGAGVFPGASSGRSVPLGRRDGSVGS